MTFHDKDYKEALNSLKSNEELGLTTIEAKKRLESDGPNKLKEKKKRSLLVRFLLQFKDAMIIILIAAAVISFIVALKSDDFIEYVEPFLILFIVIANAILGVAQESKAEKALDALKSLSASKARVIRDGKEIIINADELVVGDIVKLEAGDFVPADCRIISSSNLKSEESCLTGESVPAEKNAEKVKTECPIGDKTDMLFSGCSITYGSAKAIVTATGMNTEMGKIANLLDNEKESLTPLQKKLSDLGKILVIVAISACAIIFVVGLLNDMEPLKIFMTAVSLAVSAIPEGLPAIVTIVLSIGVQRMVKKNAVIKSLPAVETLGSASVICSDKTGTLTQNRMTLVSVYSEKLGEEKVTPSMSEDAKEILKLGTLCSDGVVELDENGLYKHIGDPTETSIVYASLINGMKKTDLEKENKRILSLPFDSDRKLMTTVNKINGKFYVITKGAFDVLEKICISGDVKKAKKITEEMSEKALRVLAVGYKVLDEVSKNAGIEELEKGLTFLGLVGMIDPPRPEAKEAVKICRKAGIKPVMITGDHVVTATAIAKELGIFLDGDISITGPDLDKMTDAELFDKVEKISVYARVSPENKIRIVKAWQNKGQVVAMTGDGVNDAPALKAADIGCAMGVTGTDVAKGAADMTLTDDNFSTIIEAVREGRGIYANIKKVVGFLLGTNIGEVLTVFLAMIIWSVSPLASIQLLWINLVTDSFPAVSLGMEAVEKDVMDKKPKPKSEGIFSNGYGLKIILMGIMFGGLTLIAYKLGDILINEKAGTTCAFIVLSLSQVVQSYNMRSNHSLFKIGVFTNKKLNLSALLSIVLVCFVLFVPKVNEVFELCYMPLYMYAICLGLILLPVLVMEIAKVITKNKE